MNEHNKVVLLINLLIRSNITNYIFTSNELCILFGVKANPRFNYIFRKEFINLTLKISGNLRAFIWKRCRHTTKFLWT